MVSFETVFPFNYELCSKLLLFFARYKAYHLAISGVCGREYTLTIDKIEVEQMSTDSDQPYVGSIRLHLGQPCLYGERLNMNLIAEKFTFGQDVYPEVYREQLRWKPAGAIYTFIGTGRIQAIE